MSLYPPSRSQHNSFKMAAQTGNTHIRVLLDTARSKMPHDLDPRTLGDYTDGTALVSLIQTLSTGKFDCDKYKKKMRFKKPTTEDLTKERISAIARYLKEEKIWEREKGGSSYQFMEAEVADILEQVLRHYLITKPLVDILLRCEKDSQTLLLEWVRNTLPPGAKPGNLCSDWEDGVLFAAMIHSKSDGDLCHYWRDMDRSRPLENLQLVFGIAATEFCGISKLLVPGDFLGGTLTETSVMIYLSQFIHAKYMHKGVNSDKLEYADPVNVDTDDYYQIRNSAVKSELYGGSDTSDPYIDAQPLGASAKNFNRVDEDDDYDDVEDPKQEPPPWQEENLSFGDDGDDSPIYNFQQADEYIDLPSAPDLRGPVEPAACKWSIETTRGSTEMKEVWRKLESAAQKKVESYLNDPDNLKLGPQIGHGNSGVVYKGRYTDEKHNSTIVAAKVVIITHKGDKGEKQWKNVYTEIQNMAQFSHPNVVRLVAVVIKDTMPYMIQPLLKSDLHTYVRRNKKKVRKEVLLQKILDVAIGMEHLHSLEFIHRDLAARNCMMDEEGRVQIGDLGLMRDVLEQDYVSLGHTKIAFRWSAPEVLSGGAFSLMSDVWSFAVLFWEVLTWGEHPYADKRYADNDLSYCLKNGHRLEKPKFASDEEYSFMKRCWALAPEERPTFEDIVPYLKELLEGDLKTPTEDTGPKPPPLIKPKVAPKPSRGSYLNMTGNQNDPPKPTPSPKPGTRPERRLPPPPPPEHS